MDNYKLRHQMRNFYIDLNESQIPKLSQLDTQVFIWRPGQMEAPYQTESGANRVQTRSNGGAMKDI